MKNFDLRKIAIALIMLAPFCGAMAQNPLLWGTSPFQDSLWSVDTTTWSVVNRVGPTMTGVTITGMNGLAWDPVGHKTYVIVKTSSTRYLGTIDLSTGAITQIGDLGMKFSTINFRSDGQLFGVTGNGQNPNPETLFLIDKTTAATTLAIALGNGADGEIISYNYDDDMFYHWSGNSTMVFEKFPAQAPYTPVTNIPTVGNSSGETFGAIYMGSGKFIISNISSQFNRVSSSGNYAGAFGSLPDDLRGLVIPPQFSFDQDTFCVGTTTNWTLNPGQARDTAVFHWGDGTSTSVYPAGSASHIYTTAGNYTTYAVLKNSIVGEDTLAFAPIVVRALPGVALTPGNDTTLCFTDSLLVNGSFGGSSQWYMNGQPISGANTNNFIVTADGWYNMTKTNLNGCTDSSHVGIYVRFGDQPAASNLADSTICDGDSVCFASNNPLSVSYLWSTGSTANVACVTGGPVTLDAMDPAGCVQHDSATVTTILAPSPSISIDSSGCPTFVFNANDPNGTSWNWDFGDGQVGSGTTVTHSYVTNGTYTVSLQAVNSCFTATPTVQLTFDCTISIDNGLGNSVQILPNPSNGHFILNANLPAASALSYSITDLHGRVLYSQARNDVRSNWHEQIDFEGASGMYFVRVAAGEQQAVYRLVIQ